MFDGVTEALREPGFLIEEVRRFFLRQRLAARREKFYVALSGAVERGELLKDYFETAATRSRTGLSPVYLEIRESLRSGHPLSDALSGWLPKDEVMVIAATENRPDFDRSLRKLAEGVSKLRAMRRAVSGPVIKSLFMLALIMAVLIGVSTVLVKPLLKQIPNLELSGGIGGALVTVAQFVNSWWTVVVVAFAAIVALVIWSLPNLTGPVRTAIDRFPLYRLYATLSATAFLMALSAMLRGNVSLREALEKLRGVAKPYVRWHISMMLENLPQFGAQYGLALNTGMIPDGMVEEIEDWTRAHDFQAALERIAAGNTDETVQTVQDNAQVLDVGLKLATGVLVGFVVLGTLDLSYSMTDRITSSMGSRR